MSSARFLRIWPEVPTCVLSPLWASDEQLRPHAASCHEQLPELLAAHVARHEQMRLIDGLELVDHDPALFAGATGCPNARGHRQMATRLNAVLRIPGLRPSSVGKRRPRRLALPEAPAEPDNYTLPLPFATQP